MTADLSTSQDVRNVIDSFCERLRRDEMISRYFQYVDWKSNLPQMYSYWSSLLLGRKEESRSEGRPFPKHMMMLGLTETQFQRWIQLFYKAIDEKYKGEKAAKMKLNIHALTLALQSRLHVMNADD